MKNILSVLLTSTVLTGAAFANAGPAPAPAAPCPPCAPCPEKIISWGGFKLGAQLGYGQASSDSKIRVEDTNNLVHVARNDHSSKSPIGGVHFGWDYQFATNWLMGLNTSFDFSSFKDSKRLSRNGVNIFRSSAEAKYTLAVVPRVGIVLKDSFFYVGAGWAGTSWKLKTNVIDNGTRRHNTDFLSALRVSVGAVQRINKVMLGVEVNYDSYSSLNSRRDDGTNSFRTSFKPRVLSGMVKASYMLCNTTTN